MAARVSVSRSFVGSSSSRTFGWDMSRRMSCRRRRSPPEISLTRVWARSRVKPMRSVICWAVISLPPATTTCAMSATASTTRIPATASSSRVSCDKVATFTVFPRRTRPPVGSTSPRSRLSTVVLPAPLTPTTPTRSPGANRHVTPRSTSRRLESGRVKDTDTSSRSMTSLPRRALAISTSSTLSRGGGASAMRASAAAMWNFGFEVRAGAPLRSHASSLVSRFARLRAATPACRARSARASV